MKMHGYYQYTSEEEKQNLITMNERERVQYFRNLSMRYEICGAENFQPNENGMGMNYEHYGFD